MIPAGLWGEAVLPSKLHRNCAVRDFIIMACSACCCFSVFHVFIVLRNFPIPPSCNKSSTRAVSVKEIGFFQTLPGSAWVGTAKTLQRAGVGRAQGISTSAAPRCPDSEQIMAMTSLGDHSAPISTLRTRLAVHK